MGNCIICGVDVDGHICSSHEEDVVFEYDGDSPHELQSGRFYRGTVDGYADFGVFVDLAPGVTGLLHRSELDQRLESLDWDVGDDVFVQVKGVRDNGNVDLGWSIRQDEREFRGTLIQRDGSEDLPEGGATAVDRTTRGGSSQVETTAPEPEALEGEHQAGDASGDSESEEPGGQDRVASGDGGEFEPAEPEPAADEEPGERVEAATADTGGEEGVEPVETSEEAAEPAPGVDAEPEPTADVERVEIGTLSDRVGELVRIEGEVVGARQTGGPTVFELRDETGVVDCAAFVEAGVRAYPEIDVGDVVRLDGEIEVRRNEIQVESEALVALEGEEREAVERRLATAMTDKARPDEIEPLAEDDSVTAVAEPLKDAAEAVRRAVFESRPIVVRHAATADGYVAGAAIERAVLPLIRDEHAKSDAEYHYFTRRPLDDAVYGMDAATNDVTRMLQDRDRHDEKFPLVLLVGTGSTVESEDGLGMLGIYGAKRVVVDATAADPEIADDAETVVNPDLAGAEAAALSTGALAANLGVAVNDDVRADLAHLPAVSYWEDTPEDYLALATDAGYDAERVTELREAVALEAFYQSYEDKRELISDLLFGDGAGDPDSLASHVAGQFREKLETELETAEANLETHETGGVSFAVLDAESYTHEYDFPPTTLLLDELHRRTRGDGPHVTMGVATDELWIRSTADVDLRGVATDAAELAPQAGITAEGVREGRIEFLSGARKPVEDAVVAALTERVY